MRITLGTTYAMIRLTQAGHTAVVAHEKGTAGFPVVVIPLVAGHVPFVDTFIIMQQDAGDVQPVGAGHAIVAVVAGDSLVLHHQVGGLLQEGELFVRQGLQGRIGAQVVLQMLHVGHAAQYGQHAGEAACEAERPRGDAVLRFTLLQLRDDVVVYLR